MCKLFISSGELTRKQVSSALCAANSIFAKSERDGFGFMCASGSRIARGRYLKPDTFTGYLNGFPDWLAGPSAEENRIPSKPDTLMIHGRTSTNAHGLGNVHPFHFAGHWLAHNGVLNWIGQGVAPSPSCDSEQFLHWLVSSGLDFDAARDNWAGFGVMGIYNQTRGVLTVIRHGAKLSIARRANGNGWVFATCQDHLLRICRAARIELDTRPIEFPERIITLNRGTIVSSRPWNGFGHRRWTALDDRSYGRTTQRIECTPELTRFPDYEPKVS